MRLLPQTQSKVLAWKSAPEDAVTFDSRAFRPLPPGAFKVGGSYAPDSQLYINGSLSLAWAHRSRLSQTGASLDSYLAGSIGPESGVDYIVIVSWVDPVTDTIIATPAASIEVGSVTAYTLLQSAVSEEDAPDGVDTCEVAVWSRRDELLCRAARPYRFVLPWVIPMAPPYDLEAGASQFTAPTLLTGL